MYHVLVLWGPNPITVSSISKENKNLQSKCVSAKAIAEEEKTDKIKEANHVKDGLQVRTATQIRDHIDQTNEYSVDVKKHVRIHYEAQKAIRAPLAASR